MKILITCGVSAIVALLCRIFSSVIFQLVHPKHVICSHTPETVRIILSIDFCMIVHCPISCDSCPKPLDLSTEEEDLLEAVAKYGEPQKVEVSGLSIVFGE